ncbi:MAG: SPOR domain-containing protein [Gammaproteobacteria bacterium]|nr:SPOR domain-containing protein [Gammaproteobacteria bacterium]
MSKNKSRRKSYQKPRKAKPNTAPIGWLVSGILIGLLISGIFYIKYHSSETKTLPESTLKLTTVTEEIKHPPKHPHPIAASSHPKEKTHANAPLQEEDRHSAKNPQYEFYNLLSSQDENSSLPKGQAEEKIQIPTYSLDMGKFKNFSEADQLKAQLILLGIDQVDIAKNPKDHCFKVVVGPFASKTEATKVQKQLKDNSILCTLNNS